MRTISSLAALVAAGLAVVGPAHAGETAAGLPAGLTTRVVAEGMVLADAAGRELYRLDLDRYRARRKQAAQLIDQRCADVCAKLWRPVAAPQGFTADGDWTAVARPGGLQQLAYKGDPLYAFTGKSLDEAVETPVAPSYFSGYAAKPARLHDGVPAGTIYWHAALYQPPAPKVAAPAGVAPHWRKAAYVFADAGGHGLYAAKGAECSKACDGLAPLAAPMAALPVGDWRPVQDKTGQRLWSYRGRLVYRAEDGDAAEPGAAWKPLEVR